MPSYMITTSTVDDAVELNRLLEQVWTGEAVRGLPAPITQEQRAQFICDYTFPNAVLKRFRQDQPQLNDEDVALVVDTLKDYFLAYLLCPKGQGVGMPSTVVDELWHTMILFTPVYVEFCQQAFGNFLHHLPEPLFEVAGEEDQLDVATLNTWVLCCQIEGQDPKHPDTLPMLFEIDQLVPVENGKWHSIEFFTQQLNKGEYNNGVD